MHRPGWPLRTERLLLRPWEPGDLAAMDATGESRPVGASKDLRDDAGLTH